MRRYKLLLALAAALLAVVFIAGCSKPEEVDPAKNLRDAQALMEKAPKEGSTQRDKDYRTAADKLNQVVKQFGDKVEGADAQYLLGVLFQTAKGPTKNSMGAYTQFNALVNKFDKTRGELSDMGFRPNEIDHILDLVAKAKVGARQAAADQDHYNRTHPVWGLPLYQVLDALVRLTGRRQGFSYWFAIVLVTIIIKLLITPLTKAQFKAMKEMQKISPLVKEIQEKYKGDQQVIGQKTMDLYKEHGINPFASCLPVLIQMPILILIFRMISAYQFQFAKGTFLWIGSGLQHMYPVPVPIGMVGTVWVTAKSLAEPDLILVVLYVISMYISTKLSAVDPTQAEQQKVMSIMMPVMFAFIFAGYPSAFLLYWLVFNIIQTIQQYLILHKGNEPALATGPASGALPEPEKPADERPGGRRRGGRRRRR